MLLCESDLSGSARSRDLTVLADLPHSSSANRKKQRSDVSAEAMMSGGSARSGRSREPSPWGTWSLLYCVHSTWGGVRRCGVARAVSPLVNERSRVVPPPFAFRRVPASPKKLVSAKRHASLDLRKADGWKLGTAPTPAAQPLPPFTSRPPNSAMQTASTAAAGRSPARYVARLAGEVDENDFLAEIGPAAVTWLREAGLTTYPSPPPPAAAHVAALPTPTCAGDESSTPRHRVLRLAGEVAEDEVVDKLGLAALTWLRANGLLTYPSPLLGGLLEEWRDVLVKHVLERLDSTDCAILARVAKPWLAVVMANNLPRAGKSGGGAAQSCPFLGVGWAAGLGEGQRVPVVRGRPWFMRTRRPERQPCVAAMGAGAWLPVGQYDVYECR